MVDQSNDLSNYQTVFCSQTPMGPYGNESYQVYFIPVGEVLFGYVVPNQGRYLDSEDEPDEINW